MTRKITFNLKNIMNKAWTLVKARGFSMSVALKKAWADAKAFVKAIADNLITEEVHTYFEWTKRGFEVIHDQKALFQITVSDAKTKNGTRVLSYFGKSQVCDLGSQPAKA